MKSQMPFYFRMFLALGYIILGIVALTTPAGELMTGSKVFGMVFGILVIIYGIFRAYRNVKRWDTLNHEK
jgi:uncharacterized membrane protein HdeD (DUF308 family)